MDKKSQRIAAKQARSAMGATAREAASAEICAKLQALPGIAEQRVIFSYMAMPEEVSLHGFHEWAISKGIALAFPVTQGGGVMEALSPDWPCQWERDRYGILIPPMKASRVILPEEIGLIIVPCVAFDEDCRRLGYGGGYYDRFFVRCPQALRVAVAFEAQKLPRISMEEYDVPMQAVLTEKAIYGALPEGKQK